MIPAELQPLATDGQPARPARRAAALVMVVFERLLFPATLLFIAATLAFAHTMDIPVIRTPFRVYAVDTGLVLLVAATGLQTVRAGRLPWLTGHLALLAVLSLALFAVGIAGGNNAADALGVLRRVAVYPASAYLIGAVATGTARDPATLFGRVMVLAAIAVVVLLAHRLLTGVGYAHAYFTASHSVPRFLSYIEPVPVTLAALLLAGARPPATGAVRWIRAALLALFIAAIAISNYRAVWLAAGVALVVWAHLAGRRARRRLMRAAYLAALVSVVAVGVLAVVNPDALLLPKLSAVDLERTVNWRVWSWSRAAEVVAASPIYGTGLGYHHVFAYLTGPNLETFKQTDGKTIHNYILWLLANGGILLAGIVATFYLRWTRDLVRAVRGAPSGCPAARSVLAVLGALAAILVIALLQPSLSASPSVCISTFSLMGVGVGLARAAAVSPAARAYNGVPSSAVPKPDSGGTPDRCIG